MLNILVRYRFTALADLYGEAVRTQSLRYDHQQLKVVNQPSCRSIISNSSPTKSHPRTPNGNDTPNQLKSNKLNPSNIANRQKKRVDFSHLSSAEISVHHHLRLIQFEEFIFMVGVDVAKVFCQICSIITYQ